MNGLLLKFSLFIIVMSSVITILWPKVNQYISEQVNLKDLKATKESVKLLGGEHVNYGTGTYFIKGQKSLEEVKYKDFKVLNFSLNLPEDWLLLTKDERGPLGPNVRALVFPSTEIATKSAYYAYVQVNYGGGSKAEMKLEQIKDKYIEDNGGRLDKSKVRVESRTFGGKPAAFITFSLLGNNGLEYQKLVIYVNSGKNLYYFDLLIQPYEYRITEKYIWGRDHSDELLKALEKTKLE